PPPPATLFPYTTLFRSLTRTAQAPALLARTPEPYLEIHAHDAHRASLVDGDFVEITSRRGKAVAQCRVTETIREGTCFLPFHWRSEEHTSELQSLAYLV